MAETTDSGLTRTDTEVEGMAEDVDEAVVVALDEATDIPLDDSLGSNIVLEDVEYIAVASVETTDTVEAMGAAMMDLSEEDDEVVDVDDETGELTIEINEAAVFHATEDGETGVGLTQMEDAGIDDALDEFEAEFL